MYVRKVIRLEDFNWGLHSEAERFLQEIVEEFLSKNQVAARLATAMMDNASLRFFDLIDHIIVPKDSRIEDKLFDFGFEIGDDFKIDNPDIATLFVHNRSTLFPVIVVEEGAIEIVIRTESLSHFIQMIGAGNVIIGAPFTPYRVATITLGGNHILSAVERRGYSGFSRFPVTDTEDVAEYLRVLDLFYTRRRRFDDDCDGLEYTFDLVRTSVSNLGVSRVCDAFFRAERQYWESRDVVGRIQKNRQDRYGIGWANDDHHTYRSSRSCFSTLIAILEVLGFVRREQFFAGQQAGWGAQVMEHPECGIVVFADVDITDEEKGKPFADIGMDESDRFGTVGLWVALHGESMLQGGLHHLAAKVDYAHARTALDSLSAGVLAPFSHFDFLKQSFSKAVRREVDKRRLSRLLEDGVISEEGMKVFSENGAIGSHLEIIQRGHGFKGFNQDAVTAIIQATDPRKN